MTRKEKLEALRFELSFLNDGGYGRSPQTPHLPRSLFVDSPTCLNFNDAERPHPCGECLLIEFVPKDKQGESVPCHHIPLNTRGQTIDTTFDYGNELVTQDLLRDWLVKAIAQLEQEERAETTTKTTV